MSEEHGTVKKAGWGCFGCGLGLMIGMLLVCGSIVLGLVWIGSMIPGESGNGSSSPDDPDSLEEEYVTGKHDEKSKIAVVNVRGVIVSDEESFDSHTAHSRQICLRIRRAASDPDVKALIVNLNTPGGEVVASDEIYAEIKRFRRQTGKPAVAMMNTMAASGGYYVAAACHPIVANKLTFTGSIGVIVSTLNYRGLFEKIGLQSEVYTSGKMKDMLNGGRIRTPEEIQIVQQLVRNTYNEFTRIVAESRKIPVEKIRMTEIGDGRIFDGEQALKLKLVDSLGYFRDAVEITARNAKLQPGSYTVVRYKEPFSFTRLMSMLSARSGSVPVNVSFGGTSSRPAFMPKPGMLYYLPANF